MMVFDNIKMADNNMARSTNEVGIFEAEYDMPISALRLSIVICGVIRNYERRDFVVRINKMI
jgi:hypothetical protein